MLFFFARVLYREGDLGKRKEEGKKGGKKGETKAKAFKPSGLRRTV